MNTTPANQWPLGEAEKIAGSDDLKISPFRQDGVTYGTPTWIWNVAVDGELYVRAYNGLASHWHQAAVQQKAGRIHAAGTVKNVSFEAVDCPINDRIDNAYRTKYQGSPYLGAMISEQAKSATIKIVPQ